MDWPTGPRCYELAQHKYLVLQVPVQTDKDLDLQVAGDACLRPLSHEQFLPSGAWCTV